MRRPARCRWRPHDHLLEQDAVLAHLAAGDLDGRDAQLHGAVAFHVVGAGGLLDEPRLGEGQLAHPVYGLSDFPYLVGVEHQVPVRPQRFAGDRHAPDVGVQIAAHLELDVIEAAGQGFMAQAPQLGVVIAQPAGRGGVAGIALAFQRAYALRLAGFLPAQQDQRLLLRDAVGHVAEIQGAHERLGREIRDQAPQRLALGLGPQVPGRVDHRRGGQVDRALVRTDPAQLAVRGDVAPETAHVGAYRVQAQAFHQVPQGLDRGAADFVAAADGEGEPVAFEPGLVGLQDHVGRGIVRIGIHRVRAVQLAGGRKTQVQHTHGSDSGHGRPMGKLRKRSWVIAGFRP